MESLIIIGVIAAAVLLRGSHSSWVGATQGQAVTPQTMDQAKIQYLHCTRALLMARQARRQVIVYQTRFMDDQSHSINTFVSEVVGAFIAVATGNPKQALIGESIAQNLADAVNQTDDTQLRSAIASAADLMKQAAVEAKQAGVKSEGEAEDMLKLLVARYGVHVEDAYLQAAQVVAVGGTQGPYIPPGSSLPSDQ